MSELKKLFESTYNKKRPSAFITKLKKNKNGEFDELKICTQFLDEHYETPAIMQRITHYVNQNFHIHLCPICNSPLHYREKPNPCYIKTCNKDECKHKYNYVATSKSIKEKYGVENISQTSDWKEKVISTNLKRRGVKWNTQSPEFIESRKESWKENKEEQLEKRYNTNVLKYGTKHAIQNKDVKEKQMFTMKFSENFIVNRLNKIKETNNIKYNSDWYISTDSFKEKTINTLLNKYGVYHNSHLAETLDKRWKTSIAHDYIFPSGKTVRVQGYESICINNLLEEGYLEEDIIVGNVEIENHIGKIIYIGNDNRVHRYYPDIFIKSESCVIEVKSNYTLSKDIEIYNKQKAVIDANLNYKLKIY